MKRTPTGWILILISWVILFVGVGVGLFYLLCTQQRILGIIVLISGIITFAVLRALSNIGEFLFGIQLNSQNILLQENKYHDELSKKIKETNSLLLNIQQKLEEDASNTAVVLSEMQNKMEKSVIEINTHIFDLQHEIEDSLFQTNTILLNIQKKLEENALKITAVLSNIQDEIEDIKENRQIIEQINCDSKDINQNLYKLTSFLEKIEKNLDLKR